MLPNLGTAFALPQTGFLLNDNDSHNRLYGPIAVEWSNSTEDLFMVKAQQDTQPINTRAVFQAKVLHPINTAPKTMTFVPLLGLPGLPILPTIEAGKQFNFNPPQLADQTNKVVLPPVPTVIPVIPNTNQTKVPSPSVPQPNPETFMTRPLIPGLTSPSVSQPTIPTLQGFVPPNTIQPPSQISLAQNLLPPGILQQLVTSPRTIVLPPLPNASTARPPLQLTIVDTQKITTPGPLSLQVIPTPSMPNLPALPRPPQPIINIGKTEAGEFTSVPATNLLPTIPDLSKPPVVKTPSSMNGEVPRIIMPTFNTRVPTVNSPVRRPVELTEAQRRTVALSAGETIGQVFSEIDPEMLVSHRTGNKKKGYSRPQLQAFASRLGLPVSGKRKEELIDDIERVRRDAGLD
jgi:hypothetical protein